MNEGFVTDWWGYKPEEAESAQYANKVEGLSHWSTCSLLDKILRSGLQTRKFWNTIMSLFGPNSPVFHFQFSWCPTLKECGASRLWKKWIMWLFCDQIKNSWGPWRPPCPPTSSPVHWRKWAPMPRMFKTAHRHTAAASTSRTSTSLCLSVTLWRSCSASSWTPRSSCVPTDVGEAASGTLLWFTWWIWHPQIWCTAYLFRSSLRAT